VSNTDSGRYRYEVEEIRDKIKQIEEILWIGNGKPGVTARLLALEGCVDQLNVTLQELTKSVSELKKYVFMGIGAVAVVELVIRSLIKILFKG
jgi:hypothetical protein